MHLGASAQDQLIGRGILPRPRKDTVTVSRKISYPYTQNDPLPGGRHIRRGRRVLVFVIVLFFGAGLLSAGYDLQTVLLTLLGLGLVSATVARWVTDDAPLPTLAAVLSYAGLPGLSK